MKKYIEITEDKTGEVIKRMDVSNKSDHAIERIQLGIMAQMDTEKYSVSEKESKTSLKVF